MDEEKFLDLVSSVVFADIPLRDLKLRQKVKVAGLVFTLCDDIDVVSRRKLHIFIPRSRVTDSPERTVEDAMVVLIRLLFRKLSRFQAEQLARSWLHEPREVKRSE